MRLPDWFAPSHRLLAMFAAVVLSWNSATASNLCALYRDPFSSTPLHNPKEASYVK
jgi:hypothetical protein